MREELNHIEQIEKYLQGKMSPEEQTAFEKKLEENPQLQTEVEAQRQIMESSFQSGIKQAAQKAFKKFKLHKNLKWGGAGAVVIGIVAAGIYFLSNPQFEDRKEVAESNEPTIEAINLGEDYQDANHRLTSQFFTIENGKDTIIETQNGILFVMPENGFLDASGQPVEGEITLEIKEAFSAVDIVQSGLTTTSNGELLETGGMFFLEAYHKGEKLSINPDDPVIADIPTAEKDKDMMLFDGEVTDDGTINWVNPKKFDNWLTPVDIKTLNFYPPKYLEKLDENGYDVADRKFTDSLYYSFAGEFSNLENGNTGEFLFKQNCSACHKINNDYVGPVLKGSKERWLKYSTANNFYKWIKNSQLVIKSGDRYAQKLFSDWNKSIMPPQNISNKDIDLIYDYIDKESGNKTDSESNFWGNIKNTSDLYTYKYEGKIKDEFILGNTKTAGIMLWHINEIKKSNVGYDIKVNCSYKNNFLKNQKSTENLKVKYSVLNYSNDLLLEDSSFINLSDDLGNINFDFNINIKKNIPLPIVQTTFNTFLVCC